jgi:hypothetical protein
MHGPVKGKFAKIKDNSLKKLVRMYGAYSRIKEKMDEDQQMLCIS